MEKLLKWNSRQEDVPKNPWNSHPIIEHEGTYLSAFSLGNLSDDGIMEAHYSSHSSNYDSLEEWTSITHNQYLVRWNINDFLQQVKERAFDWAFPMHSLRLNDKKGPNGEQSKAESVLEYYSSSKFTQYGKTVVAEDGTELTIVNYPVPEHSSLSVSEKGTYTFVAAAVDKSGEVYKVYWNIHKLFNPASIELMTDYTRQCIHCFKVWSKNMGGCIKEEHEYK